MKVVICCTGNTCRSPMAEAILRSMIKDRLPHNHQEIDIQSGGTNCVEEDGPIAPHSITCLNEQNISTAGLKSNQLSEKMVQGADYILCMSDDHVRKVLKLDIGANTKVCLLGSFDESNHEEVMDPFGSILETYQDTCQQITRLCKIFVDKKIQSTD